jgi:hypothetical protein
MSGEEGAAMLSDSEKSTALLLAFLVAARAPLELAGIEHRAVRPADERLERVLRALRSEVK